MLSLNASQFLNYISQVSRNFFYTEVFRLTLFIEFFSFYTIFVAKSAIAISNKISKSDDFVKYI